MGLERYDALVNSFGLNEVELQIFLHNYYDSFAFNEYLNDNMDYLRLDFSTISQLIEFFDANGIDVETRKRIVISMPMVFSCKNFEQQLRMIYKDSILEGIIIRDQNNVPHPYRIKKNPRSITENISMVNDLVSSVDNDYKKTYYVKVKSGNDGSKIM